MSQLRQSRYQANQYELIRLHIHRFHLKKHFQRLVRLPILDITVSYFLFTKISQNLRLYDPHTNIEENIYPDSFSLMIPLDLQTFPSFPTFLLLMVIKVTILI